VFSFLVLALLGKVDNAPLRCAAYLCVHALGPYAYPAILGAMRLLPEGLYLCASSCSCSYALGGGCWATGPWCSRTGGFFCAATWPRHCRERERERELLARCLVGRGWYVCCSYAWRCHVQLVHLPNMPFANHGA